MYEVHFYQDANGNQPVREYLDKLEEKSMKSKEAMFFAWDGNSFILLSHFMKSTQKIPKREIEKAKRLMEDFRERSRVDG